MNFSSNYHNLHYRSHCYLPILGYATLTCTTPKGQRQELPEQWILVAVRWLLVGTELARM